MQCEIFNLNEIEPISPEVTDYRVERNLARAAEFLVAFDISQRGFDCFMAGESLRYDLIADIGGVRRIQVKMRRRASYKAPGSKTLSYTFGNKTDLRDYVGDADLLAFVAMDRRTIFYSDPAKIKSANLHISASLVTPEACDLSWVDATRGWV